MRGWVKNWIKIPVEEQGADRIYFLLSAQGRVSSVLRVNEAAIMA
jgi:hypothetical protein